jgi:hypothetical protein
LPQTRNGILSTLNALTRVIRSTGSVGGNYIEASDHLGKLDEKMKIKYRRREAKESIHWLDLILTDGDIELEKEDWN